LIAANDVDVGGTLYDVSFAEGSCFSLFNGCDELSDFQFTTEASATVAAQALLDQVFIDGVSGNFDSSPSLILGCEVAVCVGYIPYGVASSSRFDHLAAVNVQPSSNITDQTTTGRRDIFLDSATTIQSNFNAPGITFAVFEATTIPIPASILLFGSTLVGLITRKAFS